MKYQVYVEEVYAGYVEIEADSMKDAEAKVTEQISIGNINPVERFDGNTWVDCEWVDGENVSD